MVPDIAKKGHSFKGAFAYYLHDKLPEGVEGPKPTTADRVAWTETRNLATDDPEIAKRIMVTTALQADELKKQAGIANTGRKSNAHVYSYALAWHPDEAKDLTREDMIKAVDSSLIALEAQHLQAVVVCHRETDHPHVHIIVNRVDPATGKMHGFNNDRHKLDAWAHAYEEARGRIVTPNRDEKHKRMRAEKEQEAIKPPAPIVDRPPSKAARLAEIQAEMKERHKQQWADLSATHAKRKEAAWQARPNFKAIAADYRAETRAETRADWSAFGKQQAQERREWKRHERTIGGVLHNAIAVAIARPIGGEDNPRNFLRDVFTYTLHSQAREAAFNDLQAQFKTNFVARINAPLDARIDAAKRTHAEKVAHVRHAYDMDRAELKRRQDLDRQKISAAWKQIYAEKERAAALARHTADSRERMTRQNDLNLRYGRKLARRDFPAARDPVKPGPGQFPPPRSEHKAMNRDFDEARKNQPPKPIERGPVQSVRVSAPAPTPAPVGAPPPPQRVQEVPKVDKVQAWAKTVEGQKVSAPQKAAPDSLRAVAPAAYKPAPETPTPARNDWSKAAAPASPVPATPLPAQPQQSPAQSDWSKASANPDKAAERVRAFKEDRDRSRDLDRDR